MKTFLTYALTTAMLAAQAQVPWDTDFCPEGFGCTNGISDYITCVHCISCNFYCVARGITGFFYGKIPMCSESGDLYWNHFHYDCLKKRCKTVNMLHARECNMTKDVCFRLAVIYKNTASGIGYPPGLMCSRDGLRYPTRYHLICDKVEIYPDMWKLIKVLEDTMIDCKKLSCITDWERGMTKSRCPIIEDTPTVSTTLTEWKTNADSTTDESSLQTTGGQKCESDQWRCTDDTLCVADDTLCDGHDNCLDRSDELNCDTYDCMKHFKKCADNETCVPITKVCNGRPDCPDKSDELSCGIDWIIVAVVTFVGLLFLAGCVVFFIFERRKDKPEDNAVVEVQNDDPEPSSEIQAEGEENAWSVKYWAWPWSETSV